MPPKRPLHGSDGSPKKRIKGESSQRSIASFFGSPQQPRLFSKAEVPSRGSSSARLPEIIVIDDDGDDVDTKKDAKGLTLTPKIMTAEPERAEGPDIVHSNRILRDTSITKDLNDDLLESVLPDSPPYESANGPGHDAITGNVSSVMSSKDAQYLSYAEGTSPRSSSQSLRPRVEARGPTDFPVLSLDPLLFDPCLESETCPWWDAEKGAPYALLAHALQSLTSTRSRIAIVSILTNVLRILIAHDAKSILPALYLLSNSLSPAWEGIELGVGGSIISKALQATTSLTPATMRNLYKKYGDPGDVAYHAVIDTTSGTRTSVLKPHPPLRIQSLYRELRKIASARGAGSQKLRQTITEKLMLSAVGSSWSTGKGDTITRRNPHLLGEEARYLVRTLVANLRVGAVRTTIVNALARAFTLTPPRDLQVPVNEVLSISKDDLQCVKVALQKQDRPVHTPSRKGKGKVEQSEAYKAAHERIQASLKHAEVLLRQAYAQHPNFDDIAEALLQGGISTVIQPTHPIGLTLGVPLMPTLGSPMRSLDEIYERLGPHASWTAEMKYDGQRGQVHAWKRGDQVNVKIFSRHLEDMTDKYPDLVHLIINTFQSDLSLQSFIVDAEVVAVDSRTGELRSFQELAGRARKDVKIADVKVAVCLFLFDMMQLNGISLIHQPFRERRRLLRTNLPPMRQFMSGPDDTPATRVVQARLDHVESVEADQGREVVEEFWEKAVESKCEGLMIKLLDDVEVLMDEEQDTLGEEIDLQSPKRGKGTMGKGARRKALPATYEPDKRTSAWLKLKKDYVDSTADSLDLVPVGAWHGNGRKAAWWSPVLVAVYDPERGVFVALCKCMSGFTDAFYEGLNERYTLGSDTCSSSSQWNVETGGYQPSVYFKPSEVWEMRGADLTISPTSVTALGLVPQSREKGLSLRFPRFIRVREDKSIETASTPSFVVQLWLSQERKGGDMDADADDGDLIDYVEEEAEDEEEYESNEHVNA